MGDENSFFGLLFISPAGRLEIQIYFGKDITDIRLSLSEIIIGDGIEELCIFLVNSRYGPFGPAAFLPNDCVETRSQRFVFKNQDVSLKNEGMLLTDPVFDFLLDGLELMMSHLQRFLQASDLFSDECGRNGIERDTAEPGR